MPYPREIYLDDETEASFISYLEDIITNHEAERGPHLEDLIRYQTDYWAKPTVKEATFPFKGAATLIIPLNAIAIEAIFAKTMTTRFALDTIVSAHAVNPDWDAAAPAFERFFNRELLDEMDVRKPIGDMVLEATKFGTMIGKVDYVREVKTSVRENAAGESQEFDVVVKDGAELDCVPDSRFLMPHSAKTVESAPWCGEEHSESPYTLVQLEQGGLFRPKTIIDEDGWEQDPTRMSKLHSWVDITFGSQGFSGGNRFDRNQEKLENTQSHWPSKIDWYELKCSFDVDKSGYAKEVIVHYHRDSRTIMSLRYNWYSDLRKGYRTNVYMPLEHRWRGIGVCKMNEQFQKEVTVQHRQRIDNATLANMRMLRINKNSGYGPREPVFPGKMWFLNDMADVDTIQMGEIYPSSYSNEQATLIYSQQRTGIGDLQLGQMQAGTPGTATSDLARIQEGNKKADYFYSNLNDVAGKLFVDCADVIYQFGPRRLAYFDNAENGKLVKQFFDMPQSDIRDGLLIAIKPTTQQHSKVLDRQNWTQLAPLITQYYDGLIQLAQLGGMPQISQIIVAKGMAAATEAMRQIFETFDVRNINRMLVTEIEDMIRNGLQNIRPQPSPDIQSPQIGQNGGMDIVARLISNSGQNGNGNSSRISNSGASV